MSKHQARLLAQLAPTVAAQLDQLKSAIDSLGDELGAALAAQEAERQKVEQEALRARAEEPAKEPTTVDVPSATRGFSATQVAERLVINPQTLWRWVRQNKFPPGVRIGPGRTIWTEEVLARWLDHQRANPGERRQTLPRERPKLRFVQSVHKGSRRWRAAGADGADDYVVTESLKLRTGTRLIDTIYLVQQGDRQLGEAATVKEAKALARADADRELVP